MWARLRKASCRSSASSPIAHRYVCTCGSYIACNRTSSLMLCENLARYSRHWINTVHQEAANSIYLRRYINRHRTGSGDPRQLVRLRSDKLCEISICREGSNPDAKFSIWHPPVRMS